MVDVVSCVGVPMVVHSSDFFYILNYSGKVTNARPYHPAFNSFQRVRDHDTCTAKCRMARLATMYRPKVFVFMKLPPEWIGVAHVIGSHVCLNPQLLSRSSIAFLLVSGRASYNCLISFGCVIITLAMRFTSPNSLLAVSTSSFRPICPG